MAMRSATARIHPLSRSAELEASFLRIYRCFSDGKGKVLSEEERAAENIYIQKMERERAEKMKLKTEKEKTQLEKEKGEKLVEISGINKNVESHLVSQEVQRQNHLKSDEPNKG